jgi:hypothetical protein
VKKLENVSGVWETLRIKQDALNYEQHDDYSFLTLWTEAAIIDVLKYGRGIKDEFC